MCANEENSKLLWADEADERLRYGKGFHWVESAIVCEYMNRNISGDPALNWVAYSAAKYLVKCESPKILSLGCGGGALERDLLRLVPGAHIIAMDFSPGAIGLAAERAAEAGLKIDYQIADLNEVELEPRAFDFVFAASALHHLARLEHILEQVRDCLKPDGKLIANDYVGPNQLQWTPKQVQAINEVLAVLPDRYRRRISNPAEYKREFLGPGPIEEMNRLDPTEAVRAQEILFVARKMFHILELKPFGGTLLHMLLQDILGNFNPEDETDNCVLKLICLLEWKLITAGDLPSDFAYFVATA
jgi:2-polyprenyl-3-methyl-5-hydroxy-6-metoxy-1,4-benzoquinol methylase